MTPRLKSALLWGTVGVLLFLALHQGYLLLDGSFIGIGPVAAVAAAVFGVTAVGSYYTSGHLETFEPDRDLNEASEGGAAMESSEVTDDGEAAAGDTDEWIWGGDADDQGGGPSSDPSDGTR